MKKTYNNLKSLYEEDMKSVKAKDKLTSFTAIYIPLSEKLKEDKLSKEEKIYLAYFMIYYLAEIEELSEEIEAFFNFPTEKLKENNDEDFKKAISLIINQDKIAEGMYMLTPFLRKFSEMVKVKQ